KTNATIQAKLLKEQALGQEVPSSGNIINKDHENISSDGKLTKYRGYQQIYNQPYSIVISNNEFENIINDVEQPLKPHNIQIVGVATHERNIPNSGKATYIGEGTESGRLIYKVDFDTKKGQGSVSSQVLYGRVELKEADIQPQISLNDKAVVGIQGVAVSSSGMTNGYYQLGFFGPEAEEVSGIARFKFVGEDKEFGFGGTRGEIQK
ncbi:MAG: factor H binding family protein, partial [Haemophilus parahaemolyticus]